MKTATNLRAARREDRRARLRRRRLDLRSVRARDAEQLDRRDSRARRHVAHQLDLLLAPSAAGEVPDARPDLPRGLPGLRSRLHLLRRFHELRNRAQRHPRAGDLVAAGLVARAGRRLALVSRHRRRQVRRTRPADHEPRERQRLRGNRRRAAHRGSRCRVRRRQSRRRTGLDEPHVRAGDRPHRRDHRARRAVLRRSQRRGAPHARRLERVPLPVESRVRRRSRHDDQHDDRCRLHRHRHGSVRRRERRRAAPGLADHDRVRQLRTRLHRGEDPRAARLRDALDLRIRHRIRASHLRARAASRARLRERPDARRAVLPRAADPALRLPRLPLGAGLGRHDESEFRVPQRGGVRRSRHPVAHRSDDGQGERAAREPLARVPVHVPDLHGRSAGDPGRALRGGAHGRRARVGAVPAHQTAADPRDDGARADRLVRVQLQQLQPGLPAQQRRPPRHDDEPPGRPHRPADLDGLQGRLHRPEPRLRSRVGVLDPDLRLVAVIAVVSFSRTKAIEEIQR